MDEKQAIQRLKDGDIGGLEFLVQRHQVKAVRTAYLITQDLAMAEDVVQESFIQAFRAVHGFNDAKPFAPWFMRSVVHAAEKSAQKAAKRVPAKSESDENRLEELLGNEESAEAQVISAEFEREVWDALQELSPRQRAAIVQRYFLDMSEKEMAESLEAPPGTVKWLLHAARRNLKSLLRQEVEK